MVLSLRTSLKPSLQSPCESSRGGSINHAMVVANGDVEGGMDVDGSAYCNGPIDDGPYEHNRCLRSRDERSSSLHASHAKVRDRDGATLHIAGRESARSGPIDNLSALHGQLAEGEPLRSMDDRHDQPLIGRDCNREIDVLVHDNAIARERRIDLWHFLQATNDSLQDEIGIGKIDTVTLPYGGAPRLSARRPAGPPPHGLVYAAARPPLGPPGRPGPLL